MPRPVNCLAPYHSKNITRIIRKSLYFKYLLLENVTIDVNKKKKTTFLSLIK